MRGRHDRSCVYSFHVHEHQNQHKLAKNEPIEPTKHTRWTRIAPATAYSDKFWWKNQAKRPTRGRVMPKSWFGVHEYQNQHKLAKNEPIEPTKHTRRTRTAPATAYSDKFWWKNQAKRPTRAGVMPKSWFGVHEYQNQHKKAKNEPLEPTKHTRRTRTVPATA